MKDSDPRRRYLNHDEEMRLLASSPTPWRDMIAFAIDTGLRREEQLTLTWDQVDLNAAHITIPITKTGNPRMVPLLDRSAQILAHLNRVRFMRAEGDSDWVFCKRDGSRYVQPNRALKAAAQFSNIDNLWWHDFRATCACRLLQDHKVDIFKVSKWLGHKSVITTERHYGFLRIEDLHEAVGTKTGTLHTD